MEEAPAQLASVDSARVLGVAYPLALHAKEKASSEQQSLTENNKLIG